MVNRIITECNNGKWSSYQEGTGERVTSDFNSEKDGVEAGCGIVVARKSDEHSVKDVSTGEFKLSSDHTPECKKQTSK